MLERWLERIENLKEVQKAEQLETIRAALTQNDLTELTLIINTLNDYIQKQDVEHLLNQGIQRGYYKALGDISNLMYQKCMVEDSDMQKWDSGCWIRYKLFENCVEELKVGGWGGGTDK